MVKSRRVKRSTRENSGSASWQRVLLRRITLMMRLPKFSYQVPRTVSDAVKMISDAGTEGMFVAGGTDLYPNMKRRQQTPKIVISVMRLREMHNISGDEKSGL